MSLSNFRSSNQWGILKKHRLDDYLKDPLLIINSLNDLNQYHLNISVFERHPTLVKSKIHDKYSGVDGKVIDLLATEMNFTPNYIVHSKNKDDRFGVVLPNGTVTGTLGDIVNYRSHMAGNGRFLTNYSLTSRIEFTEILDSDTLFAVVPKASKMPRILAMSSCFRFETWITMILILLVCTITYHFYKKLATRVYRKSTGHIFAAFVLVGIPVDHRYLKRQYIFFIGCFFYGFIISNNLQSCFIENYTITRYFDEIDSLDELDRTGLPISTSLDVLNADSTETAKSLTEKKLSPPPNVKDPLYYTCFFKNLSVVKRKSEMEYFKKLYRRYSGLECLHTPDEPIITYSISYIVPFNSPLLKKIDSIITTIRENGLITYWKNKYNGAIQDLNDDNGFQALSLGNFYMSLYILFGGYSIAILAFVAEIINRK